MLKFRNLLGLIALILVFSASATSLQAHALTNTSEVEAESAPPKKSVKLLCRKWKLDPTTLKTALEESLKEMEEEQRAMMEAMIEPMMEMMGNITFTFDAKGGFEVGGGPDGQTQSGQWTMDDKGKTMTMTNQGEEPKSFNVEKLDAKTLVLKPTEPAEGNDPFSKNGLVFVIEK